MKSQELNDRNPKFTNGAELSKRPFNMACACGGLPSPDPRPACGSERPTVAVSARSTPSAPGQCPHCHYGYVRWRAGWVVLKIRGLRVDRVTQQAEIQCRQCRRWIACPARIKKDGPKNPAPVSHAPRDLHATGPPRGR